MAYEQRRYSESDAVKKWREQMETQQSLKPQNYQSKYQPQIDSTVDEIMNRKPFQYDVNGDALFQQYKDRYVNLGQQAMMDTMGQAAKLTGGYGNSYAQMAGQQAYHGYLQGLTDKIPELAQLAQQQYNQQGQDLYQRYGLLSDQDQGAYDRWNAEYSRWLAERDYAGNQYNTERGYDYGQYRDTVGDDQWKAQFDEDLRRYNFAHGLGEFAPRASAGGGGDIYNDPDPKPTVDPTDKSLWGEGQWEAYIGSIAQTKGSAAAGKEMSSALKSGEMPQQYAPMVQMALGNASGSGKTTPKPASTPTQTGTGKNSGYSDLTRQKYYKM